MIYKILLHRLLSESAHCCFDIEIYLEEKPPAISRVDLSRGHPTPVRRPSPDATTIQKMLFSDNLPYALGIR